MSVFANVRFVQEAHLHISGSGTYTTHHFIPVSSPSRSQAHIRKVRENEILLVRRLVPSQEVKVVDWGHLVVSIAYVVK